MDKYRKHAKEQWGKTDAYQKFAEKSADWTENITKTIADEFMKIFVVFGTIKDKNPADANVQKQVKVLIF